MSEQGDEELTASAKTAVPKSNGDRSFWIPGKAVELILRHRLGALEIFSYFIICNHRDKKYKKLSKVGISGIATILGVSRSTIHKATEILRLHGLIESAEICRANTTCGNSLIKEKIGKNLQHEYIPKKYGQRPEHKWAINQWGEKQGYGIWFNSKIVSNPNSDRFPNPLKDIVRIKNRDAIARLLLIVHRNYDISFGVSIGVCYFEYEHEILENSSKSKLCYAVRATYKGPNLDTRHINAVIAGNPDLTVTSPEGRNHYIEALQYLENNGFMVREIAAYTKPPHSDGAVYLYTLDVKDRLRISQANKHDAIAASIDDTLKLLGFDLVRKDNRHYDVYHAIARKDSDIHVIGLYKPIYLPTNPKNYSLGKASNVRTENHRNWRIWLKGLVNLENQKNNEDEDALFDDLESMKSVVEPSCIDSPFGMPQIGRSLAESQLDRPFDSPPAKPSKRSNPAEKSSNQGRSIVQSDDKPDDQPSEGKFVDGFMVC